MPLDGFTLSYEVKELNSALAGGRIDKITQPEKDTVIITVRSDGANKKLLLCASANNARCHLTRQNYPNPLDPPVFCMIMRKLLLGGRIIAVSQLGGDRIVHISVDAVNEMGDHVTLTLILEIMGRYSNLILTDSTGKILEAAHHVNEEMSRVRQILPGITYHNPPEQGKISPADCTTDALISIIGNIGDTTLDVLLGKSVSGLSKVSAKEIACRMQWDGEKSSLVSVTEKLAAFLQSAPDRFAPQILRDENGDAVDALPFPYISLNVTRQSAVDSLSTALEEYFSSRDMQDRLNQKSASMVRMLRGQIERCQKKLALQEDALEGAEKMDEYRLFGELINANLWQLEKGMTKAELVNYYESDCPQVTVPLDITLTPVQNSQKYFKKYQKARSAKATAAQQKKSTLAELDYLESALLDVGKCVGESELEEIRDELVKTGYLKRSSNRHQQKQLPKSKPYKFQSSDGITIEVGKNSVQNDRLTQGARSEEMWLHAKDMPGSHVIIRCEGEIPQQTLKEAAELAAWFSKGQNSSLVPVDYTRRKFVRKPGGAAAGFVIYTNQHTAYMTVTKEDIRKITLVDE